MTSSEMTSFFVISLDAQWQGTGRDGQTCYTWNRWSLSNQCCQGTRKIET